MGGSPLSDVGRVSIGITGCILYVSNNAAGNAGSARAPFDTLAQAEAVAQTSDFIYVFGGDGTSTGYDTGFDLKNFQRLVGQAADLTFAGSVLAVGDPAHRPTIANPNADVITLSSNSTVTGVQIDPQGNGGGIQNASTAGGATISNVRIIDAGVAGTQPAVELNTNACCGTWTFSDLVIDNSAATGQTVDSVGVRLSSNPSPTYTANFADVGTISITTKGAAALEATGAAITGVFDDITVIGSSSGGVSLNSLSGFGSMLFSNLSLMTTGPTAAFFVQSAGSVSVLDSGTANITATGGPAIIALSSSGASLNFDEIHSTNSSAQGIRMFGVSQFKANAASSIINSGNTSFEVNGGAGPITYDGTINSDVSRLVSVVGRSSGVVDFNGFITDGADGDGFGIQIGSNSGATVRFDGGMNLSGFSTMFDVSGAGRIAVTDPPGPVANIINSTDTALSVVGTTITADGLTFQSVSAGNPGSPRNANGSCSRTPESWAVSP